MILSVTTLRMMTVRDEIVWILLIESKTRFSQIENLELIEFPTVY